MKKKLRKQVCVCGHEKIAHFPNQISNFGCYQKIENGNNRDFCECSKFKPKPKGRE